MARFLLHILEKANLTVHAIVASLVLRTSCGPDFARDAVRNRLGDPTEERTPRELRFVCARAFQMPAVRTLAYYRLSLGSAREILFAKALRVLFPGAPTLEIEHCRDIGPGLRLPHGHATVIWADRIGQDCVIRQQVTLGVRDLEGRRGYPSLGDRVVIGAGAIVLGAVEIGDDAVVGAGALVLSDVPPATTVVGVPARPVGSG